MKALLSLSIFGLLVVQLVGSPLQSSIDDPAKLKKYGINLTSGFNSNSRMLEVLIVWNSNISERSVIQLQIEDPPGDEFSPPPPIRSIIKFSPDDNGKIVANFSGLESELKNWKLILMKSKDEFIYLDLKSLMKESGN